MFKDKKMEVMMFATGNIYHETGTTSKYVELESFVQRVRSETEESMAINKMYYFRKTGRTG
jgi:hypothetical protein